MPHKDIDFKRLRTAVDWSVSQLEKPRNQRVEMIQQYVGSHYARGGAEDHVPVNLLELAATIYVRALAARSPTVMVTTGVDALKPADSFWVYSWLMFGAAVLFGIRARFYQAKDYTQ